ncbi:uncharacterized protein THITE_38835, partial [Thermothielavioides terrestris NRRL 8126]
QWWFAASPHEVKIVLLAKFDHTQRKIVLEWWEEETSPGPTTLEPVKRQEITIRQNEAMDPVFYEVSGGPLVLGFELLFL